MLCAYPHEWVLQHADRSYVGGATALVDSARFVRGISCLVFERLFSIDTNCQHLPSEDLLVSAHSNVPALSACSGVAVLGYGH